MTTVFEAMQVAVAHHQAGRLEQAEQIYRQVLQAEPRNAGAMHLLGLIALKLKRHDLAMQYISNAIRLDGSNAAFHANLGEVYRGLGRLDEARACYDRALKLRPDLAEVHNNLGTILQAQGETERAIACYQKAIAERAAYADAHNNLGTVYQDLQQWDAAIASYRRAAEVDATYAKAHFNLAVVFEALGQFDVAAAALRRAIAINANYPEAHYNLATLLQKQERVQEAEVEYREALRLNLAFVEAASSLGTLYQAEGKLAQAIELYQQALRVQPTYAEALYNWGTALKEQNQPQEAIVKYKQAITSKAAFPQAHYNLGVVLQELGRLDEAASAYEEALKYNRELALAHNNLGNVHRVQGKTAEAIAGYERALRCYPGQAEVYSQLVSRVNSPRQETDASAPRPSEATAKWMDDCAEAYNNLATAIQGTGDWSKALALYDESLHLNSDLPEAHFNRALILLTQEKFAEAWPEFAWRSRCKKYPVRQFKQPCWDGSPFEGRTLLVHAEQGFGDTFHFVRYLPAVRRRGGQVMLEVQPPIVPLLAQSGFENLIAGGARLPDFDLHAPLLDLPGLFRTDLETMPAQVPYLSTDPRLVELWRDKLAAFGDGFKIGIHWQGNPAYAFDRHRSFALAEFLPLADVPGIRLFSLQKNEGREQLPALADRLHVHDLAPELDVNTAAFMDTAAVMKNLDLVITSDTAAAHLAGALGVPVWLAVTAVPEWRWFLDRDDSPWYPTMRLFRQTNTDDWSDVFQRMAGELRKPTR